VKQQCLPDDFIAINDKLKRFDRDLYAKQNGKESKIVERQKERMCERQSINDVNKIMASTVNRASVFSIRDIYNLTTSRRSMILVIKCGERAILAESNQIPTLKNVDFFPKFWTPKFSPLNL
jgi:hypothetical protein